MKCTQKAPVIIGSLDYITKETENGQNTFMNVCKKYEHQCSSHTEDICQVAIILSNN